MCLSACWRFGPSVRNIAPRSFLWVQQPIECVWEGVRYGHQPLHNRSRHARSAVSSGHGPGEQCVAISVVWVSDVVLEMWCLTGPPGRVLMQGSPSGPELSEQPAARYTRCLPVPAFSCCRPLFVETAFPVAITLWATAPSTAGIPRIPGFPGVFKQQAPWIARDRHADCYVERRTDQAIDPAHGSCLSMMTSRPAGLSCHFSMPARIETLQKTALDPKHSPRVIHTGPDGPWVASFRALVSV